MDLDSKLLNKIHYNYLSGMGACYIHAKHSGAIEKAEFNIFFDGNPTCSDYNRVNIKSAPTDALTNICWWENYWGTTGRYQVVIPPELEAHYTSLLLSRGYQSTTPMRGMVLLDLHVKPIQKNDFSITQVITSQQLHDFQKVLEDSYGYSEGEGVDSVRPSILDNPNVMLFIAYCENQPAAISMSYITESIAGIYWVGTAKNFRGRGLGTAITQQVINYGIEKGCTVANLQASDEGRAMYEQMGFQPLLYAKFVSPIR